MGSAERHRQPVHVLRHRFAPSQSLVERITPLFDQFSPEFLRTYGTKQVMLARQAFYGYEKPKEGTLSLSDKINGLNELFMSRTSPLYLTGQVDLIHNDHQARLLFRPRHQEGFNTMLNQVSQSPDFQLPDLKPQKPDFEHFFYMQFPVRALIADVWKRTEVVNDVRKFVADPNAGKAYYMRTVDLANSGYDDELQRPQPGDHQGRASPPLKSAS